jgi:LAO/AO transport system kinase
LTLVESGGPGADGLSTWVRAGQRGAHRIGVTGAPGSGKSSLVDRLIAAYRERGARVGVLAVDPTSPYTGGAILGDRVRMMNHHDDADVFIRSLATRGALGGLSRSTWRAADLLDAAGYDPVIVETVGVGQSEVDIAELADTTVLVLTPNAGDAVQTFKAGVMEIADVFAVNKGDLPEAPTVVREVLALLALAPERDGWRFPVLTTIATSGTGVDELAATIARHRDHLRASGLERRVRERRIRRMLLSALHGRVEERLASPAGAPVLQRYLDGEIDENEAANLLGFSPESAPRQ